MTCFLLGHFPWWKRNLPRQGSPFDDRPPQTDINVLAGGRGVHNPLSILREVMESLNPKFAKNSQLKLLWPFQIVSLLGVGLKKSKTLKLYRIASVIECQWVLVSARECQLILMSVSEFSPVFRRPITIGSWAGLLPVTAFIASENEIEKYMMKKVHKIH